MKRRSSTSRLLPATVLQGPHLGVMAVRVMVLATLLMRYGLAQEKLSVPYQWKTPEFVFPSESEKQSMINNGSYISGNPFMLDVDVWNAGPEQVVFVTTPRFMPGTPATLSVLSTKKGKGSGPASPQLKPYPSWAWNRQGNCKGMTSVLRVKVDACGRLWAIDSGVVDLMTDAKFICPPQVLVFNLKAKRLIIRYSIPSENLKKHSLLINIAVDVRHHSRSCSDTSAYIADVTEHGLIVFDTRRGKSWRVTSSLFDPSPPPATHFTIAGESFDLDDGLFGLVLSPIKRDDRTLYFHSLASFHESWVNTSVLKKEYLFRNNTNAAANMFRQSSGERSSQTAATAMDKNSVLFFNLLSNTSLNCWNSHLPYTSQNLVELVTDEDALQFVSGMKVVQDSFGNERLWALSCRFQRLMTGSFNPNEVNFRIVTASVTDLVRGTSCEVRRN